MEVQNSPKSENHLEQKAQTRGHYTWVQSLLQSHNNQNILRWVQKQTCGSKENNSDLQVNSHIFSLMVFICLFVWFVSWFFRPNLTLLAWYSLYSQSWPQTNGNPPVSTSQSIEMTGKYHHPWPVNWFSQWYKSRDHSLVRKRQHSQ